jgi:hypothetical protein
MNPKKTYQHVHFGALLITSVYLFVVITHLFFVPNFQGSLDPVHHSIFKKNTKLLYYLVRNDRSTFSENKSVKIFPKNKSAYNNSLLVDEKLLLTNLSGYSHLFQFLPDHHHSYLSNRSIRI